jgi:hypothetical protein
MQPTIVEYGAANTIFAALTGKGIIQAVKGLAVFGQLALMAQAAPVQFQLRGVGLNGEAHHCATPGQRRCVAIAHFGNQQTISLVEQKCGGLFGSGLVFGNY